MAKPHHFKSFSDFKINTRLQSTYSISSINSETLSQCSKFHQSPSYCLSKLQNSKPGLNTSLNKSKKDSSPSKDQSFKNLSTETSEERGKHLKNIESLLKSAENFTIDEKFRVAIDVLHQLSGTQNRIGSIISVIKGILENYLKKLKEKTEQVNNLKSELTQDRTSLKILKKRFKKVAIENLSINDNYIELEDRYHKGKIKRLKMKNEINSKNLQILNLQNDVEKLSKDLNLYKKLGNKLKEITDFDSFLLIREKFKIETSEKNLDSINFSSIEKNSETFIKDSSKHTKSMSSSLIFF